MLGNNEIPEPDDWFLNFNSITQFFFSLSHANSFSTILERAKFLSQKFVGFEIYLGDKKNKRWK